MFSFLHRYQNNVCATPSFFLRHELPGAIFLPRFSRIPMKVGWGTAFLLGGFLIHCYLRFFLTLWRTGVLFGNNMLAMLVFAGLLLSFFVLSFYLGGRNTSWLFQIQLCLFGKGNCNHLFKTVKCTILLIKRLVWFCSPVVFQCYKDLGQRTNAQKYCASALASSSVTKEVSLRPKLCVTFVTWLLPCRAGF